MNQVNLLGRLVKDVELSTSGQTTFGKFSIAVNRKFKDKDGNYGADFINCISFGKTAEMIEKNFKKGNRIVVIGRIQTGDYTDKDGIKRYTTDVVVENIEFVDSKFSQQAANAGTPELPKANEGFMNIPDNAQDVGLPFN